VVPLRGVAKRKVPQGDLPTGKEIGPDKGGPLKEMCYPRPVQKRLYEYLRYFIEFPDPTPPSGLFPGRPRTYGPD